MGQKVNPRGLRMQLTRDWDSVWYADKNYASCLHQDMAIRRYIEDSFKHASVSRVVIKRQANSVFVTIHAVKAGVIIGKGGADIEKIKQKISSMLPAGMSVDISVLEAKKPEICACLVANSVCQQLEKRVSFRKAMKRAISSALRFGAKGIRISCSGRLGGAEIARTEWYREGSIPLHTLKANVDYSIKEAHTIYGVIGTKVWIYT